MMTLTSNLAEFNATLRDYAKVAGKDYREVIASRASRFGFNLSKELRTLKPEKGEIRAKAQATLDAGKGISVRKAAVDFARKNTIATASRISDRSAAMFMETNRKGGIKRDGLSFWALAVRREINIRESGRGILSHATKFRGLAQKLRADQFSRQPVSAVNRYRRQVGRAVFDGSQDGASLSFVWGDSDPSSQVAEGLTASQQTEAVKRALTATRTDMLQYIARKRKVSR